MAIETDKVARFVDGLRYGIRGPTAMSDPQTLLQAINSARRAERELNRAWSERIEGKRKMENAQTVEKKPK